MKTNNIFYKLTLAYNGTYYKGWQSQTNSGPTIQDTLNLALVKIFKDDHITSLAAGRTDAGVSALEQIVKISVPFEIEKNGLLKAINTQLPADIRVMGCERVGTEFHPIRDAKKRVYRYYFNTHEVHHPLQVGLIYNYPYDLDFEMMHNACSLFIGTHDFLDFHCKGSEPSSTVRNIFTCEIISPKADESYLPGYHYLEISGEGFLKQMVRCIMGSLLEVGRGKLTLEQINDRLKNPIDKTLSFVAPASGLIKYSVEY